MAKQVKRNFKKYILKQFTNPNKAIAIEST